MVILNFCNVQFIKNAQFDRNMNGLTKFKQIF
jgi:hypothetical protein